MRSSVATATVAGRGAHRRRRQAPARLPRGARWGTYRAKPEPMTAVTGARDDRRASPLGVGVVVWLASELMFFAGLFAAYFTLRSAATRWPPDGVELTTGRTAIATAVLVASSFTMHGAVKAAQREDR